MTPPKIPTELLTTQAFMTIREAEDHLLSQVAFNKTLARIS